MNFSASRTLLQGAFSRRLSKLLQNLQNPSRISAYHQHHHHHAADAFSMDGRKPVLFDGRGVMRRRDVSGGHITSKAAFHTSSVNQHGEYEWQDPKSEEEIVQVHFVDKEGKPVTIRGKVGDNLLYVAKRFEVEMEGACEASLACTTCHIYVDHDFLDLLPEATETEEDLLDQAPFLRDNSRLGCQIILNKQLDGIKLTMPAATKNFYVDGHKPTPH